MLTLINKNHKQIKIITIVALVLFAILELNRFSINAQSAVVNLDPKSVESSDRVDVEVYGRAPVYTSGYSIRINYNNEAFEYLDTEFVDYSGLTVNATVVEPGILELNAQNGSIPFDENILAIVKLRALDPGVATILIANSKFYDYHGNTIPGTMLKYYQVETNFTKSSIGKQNNDTTTQDDENLGTVGTTSKVNLESTSIARDSSSTSINIEKTTESLTNESSFDADIPKKSTEIKTDYTNIFKPILIITIIILIAILLIYIINKWIHNKRKD